MTNPMSRRFVVFAGLLATPVVTAVTPASQPTSKPIPDARVGKLQKFFGDRDCPLRTHAAEFIEVADRNHLDWRLLPSISVVESGGGKDYKNNNVFGWANCKQTFPTVSDGIHTVARRLSISRLYRHKSLDRILATYNPEPAYSLKVKSLMRSIAMARIDFAPAAN